MVKLFLFSGGAWKFTLVVIFSFAFSIAVILGTIGLMDGFEKSLKLGLKEGNGQVIIGHHEAPFNRGQTLKKISDLGFYSSPLHVIRVCW